MNSNRVHSRLVAVVVVSTTAAWLLGLSVGREFVGVFSDSIRYLLMAEFFSPFARGQHPAATSAALHSPFPPLFPLVLSWLGVHVETAGRAHLMNALLWLAAFMVAYRWMVVRGLSVATAGILILVSALGLAQVQLQTRLASEGLFMLLLAITFLVAGGEPDRRRLLLGAFVIGATTLVRAVGLALIPAFALSLSSRKLARVPISDRVLAVAVSIVPFLAWQLLRPAGLAHSYFEMPGLDEWMGVLGANVAALSRAWFSLVPGDYPDLWILIVFAAIAGAIAIASIIVGALKREFEPSFLGAYLLVILVWPYPEEQRRFLVPLLPFLLWSVFRGLVAVPVISALTRRWLRNGALAVLALITLIDVVLITGRMTQPLPPDLERYRRTELWLNRQDQAQALAALTVFHQMYLATRKLGAYLRNEDCVFAPFGDFVVFHAGVATVETPPPGYLGALDRCSYILMVDLVGVQRQHLALYPLPLIRDRMEPIFVFWDSSTNPRQPNVIFARLLKGPSS